MSACTLDFPCCDSPRTRASGPKDLMTNVKCFRCGVLNVVADEMCNACGIELSPHGLPQPEPTADPNARSVTTITSIPPFNGVGDVLGPALSLFFKNIWVISKIVFVVVAPFEIFKALSIGEDTNQDWSLTAGVFALGLVCKALIAPALIYTLMKLLQTGTSSEVNEAYRWGLSKLAKLSVCALMAWGLQIVGFAMLIIPGIILSLAFELVYPMAVLEQYSPWETIKRSYNLTKGHRWNILLAGIVMGFVSGLVSMPASIISGVLLVQGVTFWPIHASAAIISDIAEQSTTVLSLVIYLSILRTLD